MIIRNPIHLVVSKDTVSADVKLPALIPGINFISPFNHPFFNITIVLALLPDLEYNAPQYKPVGFKGSYPLLSEIETGWKPTLKGMEAQEIQLQLPPGKAPAAYTLVVSAGIIFGKVTDINNQISPVKYAGAAKILAME